jgi:3-dehydroquinate dehydratase type I
LQLCVSIGEPCVACSRVALSRVPFAEVRLDLIKDIDIAAVKKLFTGKKTLIATCRAGRFSEAERLALLGAAVNAGASYIDLDYDSDLYRNKLFLPLIAFARKAKCGLIVSRHFNEKMPTDRQLFDTVKKLAAFDPAYIKVAARADSEEAAARLLALLALDERVVPVTMGEWGPAGRIAALSLGAPFTYVSPTGGRQTAPGQLDLATAKKLLK